MRVELAYRIVDVFSDRPLAGNALCVVLDPCPVPVMQAIAREVNLSETAFPTVTGDGTYELRIFTPAAELPYAGHPSLGTAWVLGPGRWRQVTEGATVVVEADEKGAVMTQPDPEFEPADASAAVAALKVPSALGAWRCTVGGLTFLVALTEAPLAGAVPDLAAVAAAARAARSGGLAVARRVDDATVQARVFYPGAGLGEDPGTGAAAGPVALLARRVLGTAADVTILQGDEVGRPCRIEVHAEEGAMRVGGPVAACAEGRFTL